MSHNLLDWLAKLPLVFTGFALKYPDSWWSAPFLLWGKQDGFRGLLQRTAPIVLIAAVNNFALRHFPKWITDAATAVHW